MVNYASYQRLPQLNTRGPNILGALESGHRMGLANLAEKRATVGEERAQGLHGIALAAEARAKIEEQRKAEKHAQETETRTNLNESERLELFKKRIVQAGSFIPRLNKQNYGDWMAMSVYDLELPAEFFKQPEEVASMTGQQFEAYKRTLAMGAADLNKLTLEEIKENSKRASKKPKLGELRKFLSAGKEITHEWDGKKWKELAKSPIDDEEKVPPQVKQAQTFVLKFAESINPIVAALITMNPAAAKDPKVQKELNKEVPQNLRPAYDEAVKILNEYYGVSAGSGSEGITHEFVPGKGLVEVKQN